MKIFQLLTIVSVSGLSLIACNDSKKETTTPEQTPVAVVAKDANKEGVKTEVTAEQVPDTIELLFAKKYPKASKTTWMKYEPVESDDMKMDDQYYYAVFNSEGADYTAWYNNRGEWVKTSTRVTGNANLPDAVNKTINAQYPGYTIVEIDKENDKDMDMYEIELKNGDKKAKLKILPNGEVFKRKEK
ncbi:PepSY-like domain-containing protein [Ferruginibacter sp. HRS2-29]|uniref:PepSY-like domain-containing protein n=1 Tax=Ferruginibacter sp. HRS2-29 TaxID=2487334 RepID=UPI0020CF4D72|nr:PepSY-like domain-containing protein [Ferruginibacter sp. HRS2-29]MCP9752467.1 hypothetical protein [Ferruginibacter sp. HRS2-29]